MDERFVARPLEGETMAELCAAFGIFRLEHAVLHAFDGSLK